MRTTAKQIFWPFRGVSEGGAYHDPPQAPFAAPFATNVCSLGPLERRDRGGSLPGLSPLPAGAEVRDLHPGAEVPAAASAGTAPSGAAVTARYRDRVFAASGADWFCSRAGDPSDWDYGADAGDVSRACAGSLALAGERGEAVTAVMPVDDGTLYLSTQGTLWRMTGDPAGGGEVSLVSREYGAVGPRAWCAANRRLLFVSRRGLVSLSYGEAPSYKSGAVPGFPTGADTVLGFDASENRVFAFSAGGSFLAEAGMGDESFPLWPVPLGAPEAVGTCGGRIALRYGGVWKAFDGSAPSGPSRVALGPFRLSPSDDADGMLAELHVCLAEGGAGVEAAAFAAASAELAVKAAASGAGGRARAMRAGRNAVWRPRLRGAWCVVVLSCAGGTWAFESARAVCRPLGRLRA